MSPTPHLPRRRALDGVRGVAVLAVLWFHGGRLEGGFLGVDLFFVLSGFLITSLLLVEAGTSARIGLLAFWARRARRLLPALFLVVGAVGLYAAFVAAPEELQRIRGDAWATLAYVANWRFVVGGFDYFALFRAPSPLDHTWSLAIEEQFYVLWPLVMLGILGWGRRRGRTAPAAAATARRTFVVSAVLAVGFAALSLAIWWTTNDATRVYYGTDTRAPSILIGCALGAFLTWQGPARSRRVRAGVELGALVGVAVLAVAWTRLSGVNVYRGGLLVTAVAGAAIIAAAAHPEPGLVARVLGTRPLVGLGLVSYGVYLWHWPIYVWLDERRTGIDGWALLELRLAVTLAVALVSYRFVEQPIRRGAFGARTLAWLTPVAAALLVVVTVITTADYRSPAAADRAGITRLTDATRQAQRTPAAGRLLVVGNSVAYYLGGEGFSELTTKPATVTFNDGRYSCVFPASERTRFESFGAGNAAPPCDDGWTDAIRRFEPDTVIMAFSATGTDQYFHDGRWIVPCDAAYRDWYSASLAHSIDVLSEGGARVVVTTSPYTTNLNDTDAVRTQADCTNALTRKVLSSHPQATLIDLAQYVCPSRTEKCRAEIDGVELRPDGVHYRDRAARMIARWIRDQANAT